jgi:hypothetical protein
MVGNVYAITVRRTKKPGSTPMLSRSEERSFYQGVVERWQARYEAD